MQTIQALTETLTSEEIGSYRDEILVTEASSSGSDTKKHICCITSVPEVPDYARNARKHFNSKDFPQKETLVTESDHDDTEALRATKLGTAFDLPRMESSVNFASERNLHYGIGK
ncbi:hypothetical protein POTOM_048207 [Populus tomentosa]|uniref:Uncharacterized protein n=1 Tax=Populus tomentosa TaxID=118781 RepID=A0A8X7YDW2_POPTO|nr:hypothetical protein POTOM_048207 [Populus tomentosa]